MVMAHVKCRSWFHGIHEDRIVAWYHRDASDNRAYGVLHVSLHRWKARGAVFMSETRVRVYHLPPMICFGALVRWTVHTA